MTVAALFWNGHNASNILKGLHHHFKYYYRRLKTTIIEDLIEDLVNHKFRCIDRFGCMQPSNLTCSSCTCFQAKVRKDRLH